jgi:hypothetical protein
MGLAVELEEHEWQQAMGLIALGPWREANPLLMKIGAQLQARRQASMSGNAGDIHEEAGHG